MTTQYTFQQLILKLQNYWIEQGCTLLQPYDLPVGAATFHPATFLRAVDAEPWRCVYMQGCRRPTDGRYGKNPNRLQHYYQLQVILKPPPADIQNIYLRSLQAIGINPEVHDIRFVEDNWESPTLGAWGLGWEVQLSGMEISQFTYFQQAGGLECDPVTNEITYGLERLAMYLQQQDSVFNLIWDRNDHQVVRYHDLFLVAEQQQSRYNFQLADTAVLMRHYDEHEKACRMLVREKLPMVAFEQVVFASHVFNLLDARHAVSATERQAYILRTRRMAQHAAQLYRTLRDEARR